MGMPSVAANAGVANRQPEGGAYSVGDIWLLRCLEEGDGGISLGWQDVHQGVGVAMQGHGGRGLQQLPVQCRQHPAGKLPLSEYRYSNSMQRPVQHWFEMQVAGTGPDNSRHC